MSTEFITIIIPTYGRNEYLQRAIRSALNQSHRFFEIIIVDDNGYKTSQQKKNETIISQLGYNHIKYIVHDKNLGGSAARNSGIKNAKYDYIAFLDDDDVWLKDKLAKQVEIMSKSSENLGLVHTGFKIVDLKNKKKYIRLPSHHDNPTKKLLYKNFIGTTSTIMCKRECLESAGLFDESLPIRQDLDLYIRLSTICNFGLVNEILAIHFLHHNKKISQDVSGRIFAYDYFYKKYFHYFTSNRKEHALYLYKKGNFYLKHNNYHEARTNFSKAIHVNPLLIKSYSKYILSYLKKNDYE